MTPKPGWTEGLGELIRAYRKYTGLSQRTFADRCGMREKSLSDIEIGRRDAPDGLIETVEAVVTMFDDEVDKTVAAAEEMLEGKDASVVNFRVSEHPDDEWVRAVIGRAAVISGLIRPELPEYVQS